jgi:hypothetical protein
MVANILSPAVRAYRSCGFHNRTLAELRREPSLCRRAELSDNPHVAHVPNVFGSFEHKGVTYHTVLTLLGIEDPSDNHTLDKRSRGLTKLRILDHPDGPNKQVWEFSILLPKRYCHEDSCVTQEEDASGYDDFCESLKERTSIFAMEFLCCYRFFIEQMLETFRLGNSEVREPSHPSYRA